MAETAVRMTDPTNHPLYGTSSFLGMTEDDLGLTPRMMDEETTVEMTDPTNVCCK